MPTIKTPPSLIQHHVHLVRLLCEFVFSPRTAWAHLREQPLSIRSTLYFMLMTGILFASCLYISLSFLGWEIQDGRLLLFHRSATLWLSIGILGYFFFCVLVLTYVASQLAPLFELEFQEYQLFQLLVFSSSPIGLTGLAFLYPHSWFFLCFFMIGVFYSIYLLYLGTPILCRCDEDQSFIFSTTLLTSALILMVTSSIIGALLWFNGWLPSATAVIP